jgi:GNAT superfamily N-acetyltransferase
MAPQQVTPAILELFDLSRPTMPLAFSASEGVTRGQILVDDHANHGWAVVREETYGTVYFGGQMNASLLTTIVEHFRQVGEVGIGCWPNDPLNEMIPAGADYDGRTLYFTERAPRYDLSYSLPSGYTLAPRDARLFARSFDYASTLDAFGSVENVLKYTKALLILNDQELVCEAATGAPTHGRMEIGVTTAEAYRGQGFGTIACAHLIETCKAQGYHT